VKEAYLKNVGIGLRKPLNSFEVSFKDSKPMIIDNLGYEILQMKLAERYIVSICADIRDKEFNIVEVEL
jgi:phosphopantetheinyl transferase